MGYGACGGERTLQPEGTEAHCCYFQGEVCPLLVDWGGTVACSLMLLSDGDWDAVYADPRYQAWIAPRWTLMGGGRCGDWPEAGDTCGDCGAGEGAISTVPVALKQNQKRALEREVVVPQLEAWAAAHPDEGG